MTQSPTTTPVCSQTQQRYLLKELSEHRYYQHNRRAPKRKEPAPVAAARKKAAAAQKIIDSYETAVNQRTADQEAQFEKLRSKAKQAIYFGTPEEALAAVDAVRNWTPPK